MKKEKFPKTLYVKREYERDESSYLVSSDEYGTLAEHEDTTPVAVYELKIVRKAVNKTELVD